MNDRFELDMTAMFAIHDALRRDLKHVLVMDARTDGWDLFAKMLHVHHVLEDELLWPVVRDAATGQADDLALLDEMVNEHAAIDPLLEAIDAALTQGRSDPDAGAELAARLEEHLSHEEEAALPLIDRTLTPEQWVTFGRATGERMGPDLPTFWPWVLDGATAERTQAVLDALPEPMRDAYRNEWHPAYAARDWWAAV